jgi:hypothetical protein
MSLQFTADPAPTSTNRDKYPYWGTVRWFDGHRDDIPIARVIVLAARQHAARANVTPVSDGGFLPAFNEPTRKGVM